mgnify:CR=1 FL=1
MHKYSSCECIETVGASLIEGDFFLFCKQTYVLEMEKEWADVYSKVRGLSFSLSCDNLAIPPDDR